MTVVNESRTFGVEIEFKNSSHRLSVIADKIDIALKVEFPEQGCTNPQYNHRTLRTWKIVTDASVQRGGELVSPPLPATQKSFRQIEIVTKVLRDMGSTVDSRCGLHVHQDANDLSVRQVGHVVGMYSSFQTLINYGLSPSRRRTSGFTKIENYKDIPMVSRNAKYWNKSKDNHLATLEIQHLKSKLKRNNDRYKAVNLQSLGRYGTIEFRQHQGTLNAKKIQTWILVTQALIERFVQHPITWTESTEVRNEKGLVYKKGEWRRFVQTLSVALSQSEYNRFPSTAKHENPELALVYTNAFKDFYKTIKRFMRQENISMSQVFSTTIE